MGGSRGGTGSPNPPPPPPLKTHKNIGFLCNTGPDPLKKHKATKPAFNVGPSSAHQRNAIYTMMIVVQVFLNPLSPHQVFKIKLKKIIKKRCRSRFTGVPMMAQLKWHLDLVSLRQNFLVLCMYWTTNCQG